MPVCHLASPRSSGDFPAFTPVYIRFTAGLRSRFSATGPMRPSRLPGSREAAPKLSGAFLGSHGAVYSCASTSARAVILRGEKPADLPVQQPTKFEFALDFKTAMALGIEVPTSILLRSFRLLETLHLRWIGLVLRLGGLWPS
jgi:hypothetical protein